MDGTHYEMSLLRGVVSETMDGMQLADISSEVTGLRRQVAELTKAIETMRRQLPSLLVSIPVAAEKLGMSVRTVHRKIKAGSMPHVRVGSTVRIDLSRIPTAR